MKSGFKRVAAVIAMLAVLTTAFSFGTSAAVSEEAAESGTAEDVLSVREAFIEEAEETALADIGAGEPVEAIEAAEATEPVYPIITKLENVNSGVTITWDSFEANTLYRVYYYKNNTWARLAAVQGNSYTDTAVKDGETRVYTLRAVDAKGQFTSDFNREGWSHTYFAAPVIDSLLSAVTGVSVKWTRPDEAGLYRVYRKVGNGSWQLLTQTDAGEYTDTTAVSGTTYRYTLRMVTPDGSSFMSGHNSGKTVTFVAAPQITAAENKGNGVKITWAASEGASAYCVYYRANNTWKKIAQVKGTSYTDTAVKDGETRTYTVRCLGADGKFCSDYNREGVSGIYYAPPVIASTENVYEGVKVKWSPIEGAGHYRLYRKVGGGSWQLLTQTDAGEYTDTTAVSGTKYTYTLRMVSDDGKRFISDFNSGKTITYVAAPAVTKLENTAAGIKLTWSKPAGAEKFRVYVKNGGWTRLTETTATSFVHEKLTDKTVYTYTVRCIDSKGKGFVSGFDSTGWSHTYLAAPAVPTVTAVDDQMQITWEAVDDIAGYRLYRKTVGGSWARLVEATAETSYLDGTAKKDTLYTYTVRLLDEENNTISGYIDNDIYYYNGKLADGTITSGDSKYYFDNGKLRSGFQIIDKKRYYYDTNGALVKNDIVGSDKLGWYFADEKGVCCESEEIRLAAAFMAKYCKGKTLKEKAKYAFMYLANNYPYRRSYDHPRKVADIPALAVDIFTKRSGNCYRYAAAYACIAKIAGYRARVAVGDTGGMPHGWTEVYDNGRWYYCDVDANLPNYGRADYGAYMMTTHCWPITTYFRGELFIEDGKAVWK